MWATAWWRGEHSCFWRAWLIFNHRFESAVASLEIVKTKSVLTFHLYLLNRQTSLGCLTDAQSHLLHHPKYQLKGQCYKPAKTSRTCSTISPHYKPLVSMCGLRISKNQAGTDLRNTGTRGKHFKKNNRSYSFICLPVRNGVFSKSHKHPIVVLLSRVEEQIRLVYWFYWAESNMWASARFKLKKTPLALLCSIVQLTQKVPFVSVWI